jgi:hypothetical protein
MKAQDLRIGNIVAVNHFKYGDIYASVTYMNNLGNICLDLLDERFTGEGYEFTLNAIKPITINEEVLLKIGFSKRKDGSLEYVDNEDEMCIEFLGKYIRIGYARMYHCPEDVTECEYSSEIDMPSPLFVHTLQNIWYLLTGKELEIKL